MLIRRKARFGSLLELYQAKQEVPLCGDPCKIKIKLLQKDLSMAELGRSMGLSRSYISHVIAGRIKTPKVRRAIERALGEKFWNNNKKDARPERRVATPGQAGMTKNRRAA